MPENSLLIGKWSFSSTIQKMEQDFRFLFKPSNRLGALWPIVSTRDECIAGGDQPLVDWGQTTFWRELVLSKWPNFGVWTVALDTQIQRAPGQDYESFCSKMDTLRAKLENNPFRKPICTLFLWISFLPNVFTKKWHGRFQIDALFLNASILSIYFDCNKKISRRPKWKNLNHRNNVQYTYLKPSFDRLFVTALTGP